MQNQHSKHFFVFVSIMQSAKMAIQVNNTALFWDFTIKKKLKSSHTAILKSFSNIVPILTWDLKNSKSNNVLNSWGT